MIRMVLGIQKKRRHKKALLSQQRGFTERNQYIAWLRETYAPIIQPIIAGDEVQKEQLAEKDVVIINPEDLEREIMVCFNNISTDSSKKFNDYRWLKTLLGSSFHNEKESAIRNVKDEYIQCNLEWYALIYHHIQTQANIISIEGAENSIWIELTAEPSTALAEKWRHAELKVQLELALQKWRHQFSNNTVTKAVTILFTYLLNNLFKKEANMLAFPLLEVLDICNNWDKHYHDCNLNNHYYLLFDLDAISEAIRINPPDCLKEEAVEKLFYRDELTKYLIKNPQRKEILARLLQLDAEKISEKNVAEMWTTACFSADFSVPERTIDALYQVIFEQRSQETAIFHQERQLPWKIWLFGDNYAKHCHFHSVYYEYMTKASLSLLDSLLPKHRPSLITLSNNLSIAKDDYAILIAILQTYPKEDIHKLMDILREKEYFIKKKCKTSFYEIFYDTMKGKDLAYLRSHPVADTLCVWYQHQLVNSKDKKFFEIWWTNILPVLLKNPTRTPEEIFDLIQKDHSLTEISSNSDNTSRVEELSTEVLPDLHLTFPTDMPESVSLSGEWLPLTQHLYEGTYSSKTLNFHVAIPNIQLTLTHIEHLAKVIPQCAFIETIDCSHLHFTPEAWSAFVALLPQWKGLKELILEDCLHQNSLPALTSVLSECPSLTLLDISHNADRTTPEEVGALIEALTLSEPKKLQRLQASHNQWTDEYVDLLWENLPHLLTLETIDLSYNQLTQQSIQKFVKQESQVIHLDIQGNPISRTQENKLIARLKENKVQKDTVEIEQWDARLRETIRKDSTDYTKRNSKNNFVVRQFSHGGTVSLTHSKELKLYDIKREKPDNKLFYFLEYLRDYLLEDSISSMANDSLDTPIVLHLMEMFLQIEHEYFIGLRHHLDDFSVKDHALIQRARKNTPTYVMTFSWWFLEQYQRALDRARLGLSIESFLREVGENLSLMERLKTLPRPRNTEPVVRIQQQIDRLSEDVLTLKEQMNAMELWRMGLERASDSINATLSLFLASQGDTEAVNIQGLQGTLHFMEELIHNWEKKMSHLSHHDHKTEASLNHLRKMLDEQRETLARLGANSHENTSLTPEQHQYVTHFQQCVSRIYLAAMMISTGLFQYQSAGRAGKAATVVNFLGDVSPVFGGGMKIFGSLLKTTDEMLLKDRMNRLLGLGGLFDVMTLSEKLAIQLSTHLDLSNPVSDSMLDSALSLGVDLSTADGANTISSGLFQIIQTHVTNRLTDLFAQPPLSDMAQRAEQDANLLIARISQDGVPKGYPILFTEPSIQSIDTICLYINPQQQLTGVIQDTTKGPVVVTFLPQDLGQCYTAIEERAKQGSQLITPQQKKAIQQALGKKGHRLPETPLTHALLFYAMPLLAIADRVFIQTLTLFCLMEQCQAQSLTYNEGKKKGFYQSITQVLEYYAYWIENHLTDSEKRGALIENVARRYTENSSSVSLMQQQVGLFYFKGGQRKKVSMCNNLLTREAAEKIVKTELKLC